LLAEVPHSVAAGFQRIAALATAIVTLRVAIVAELVAIEHSVAAARCDADLAAANARRQL
jgi:hypothetical protein